MTERRLRADAQDNRERLLDAARTLIDSETELHLNAVAKAAGVGQGTLYRHFPTREALLTEVYRADVAELVSSASALLAHNDPVMALSRWFDGVANYARIKRGVLAALETDDGGELTAASSGSIGDAITTLLDAGKAEGMIRPDVDARDVLLLLGFLSRLSEAEANERARHLLTVVLDGLRIRR